MHPQSRSVWIVTRFGVPLEERRRIPLCGVAVTGGGVAGSSLDIGGGERTRSCGAGGGGISFIPIGVGVHEYIVGAEDVAEAIDSERPRAKGPMSLTFEQAEIDSGSKGIGGPIITAAEGGGIGTR
jgi:hypothetical protein